MGITPKHLKKALFWDILGSGLSFKLTFLTVHSCQKMFLAGSVCVFMEKQLLTGKELAHVIGCSWRHVQTLREKRQIPFVKLGRLVRYNPQEVMKAIEKMTTKEHDHASKSKLFKS